MSEFAQMLEEARKAQGLSQVRAAAAVGTSPTTWRQWLRGQRPDWDRVQRLVEFIGRDETDVLRALLRHGTLALYITWKNGEQVLDPAGEWAVRPIDVKVAA